MNNRRARPSRRPPCCVSSGRTESWPHVAVDAIVSLGFDTNQAMTATHKTRRNFIAGLGALIASAPFVSRSAQTGERAPRIDVHHHVSFPRFDQALKAEGVRTVPWTVEQSVAEMDKSGIALAV